MALSGRRAEAAANDERIIEAARGVFIDDPGAPVSAVAARAGVGISALYRRYASKDDLVRAIVADGLARYIAAVETALADEGDAWTVFSTFLRTVVDADLHATTLKLIGTFPPSDELNAEGRRAGELNARLFGRTQAAGAIREDLDVNDLTFLFEQIAAVRVKDPERSRALRRRYLALTLAAIRPGGEPLPEPPPSWQENAGRWQPS